MLYSFHYDMRQPEHDLGKPALARPRLMTGTDDRMLIFLLLRKRDQVSSIEALPFVNERYDSVRDVSLRIC